MAAINFPTATSNGQTFTADTGVIYTYIGTPPNGFWSGTFGTTGLATLDGRYIAKNDGNSIQTILTQGLKFNNGSADTILLDGVNAKVGIGTSSPEEVVHIAAASETANSRDGVMLQSTSSLAADTGLPLVFSADIGGGFTNYGIASIAGRKENATSADAAGYLQFATGSSGGAISEKMRIDSSGNVGVGTSSPNVLLTLNSGTGNTLLGFQQSDTTHAYIGTSRVTNGVITGAAIGDLNVRSENKNINFSAGGSTSIAMQIDSSGKVGIGTTSPSGLLHLAGSAASLYFEDTASSNTLSRIYKSGSSLFINSRHTTAGQIVFNSENSSGTVSERMRIDSSGRLLLNSGPDVRIELGTNGTTGTNDRNHLRADGDNMKYNSCADGGHIFEANGGERMRIDSSGNVGIGTAPDVRFHVADTSDGSSAYIAEFENLGTADNTGCRLLLRTQTGSTNTDAYIESQGTSGGNSVLKFATEDSGTLSERLRIDSSGRLGIGTTSPGYLLDLSHPSNAYIQQTRGSNVFILGPAGDQVADGVLLRTSTNGPIRFDTNGSNERMRIDSSGNVGIGTIDALRPLTISKGGAEGLEIGPGESSDLNLSLHFNRSSNVYVVNEQRASAHTFFIQGNEKMQIDSSGRLLVGTTSARTMGTTIVPSLQVEGTSNNNSALALVQNNSAATIGASVTLAKTRATSNEGTTVVQSNENLGSIYFDGADGANLVSAARIFAAVDGTPGSNDMPGRLVFSTTDDGASSPTERMRINSLGNVLIGTTALYGAGGVTVRPNITEGSGQIAFNRASTTNTSFCLLFKNNGVDVGSISYTNSSTAFNTSSDYRLKENVVDLVAAIPRLKTLPVYQFNFISNPDKTVDGFLAHEAQLVVPESVTGTHNAVDGDGNPIYQSIDQAKLVPLLTAALQEAIGRIETLETEVAALKAG